MQIRTLPLALSLALGASLPARAQDRFVAVDLSQELVLLEEGAPDDGVTIADPGTTFVKGLMVDGPSSGWFVSTFTQSGTETGFYRFDDGVVTKIAPLQLPSNGSAANVAWRPGMGWFYFSYSRTLFGSSTLYRGGFDGSFTPLADCVLSTGQPAFLSGIAIEPGTGRLLGYHRGPDAALVVIDPTTGISTPIAPSDVPDYPAAVFVSMDFSPCGKLAIALNFGTVFQVNVDSGQIVDEAPMLQMPFPTSAIAYVPEAPPVIGTSYCKATSSTAGMPAALCVLGSQVVAEDDLMLWADHLPPGQPTLFFHGPTAVELPFANGFRCVGGPLVRVAAPTVSNPAGTASQPVGLAGGAIAPGATRHFQAWFRDPVGAGSNLSDGVRVEFR